MLPTPTIRKFFRETFSGAAPIVIEKKPDRIAWLEPLRDRLNTIPRVECRFQHGYDHHKTQTRLDGLYVAIASPEVRDHSRAETFALNFTPLGDTIHEGPVPDDAFRIKWATGWASETPEAVVSDPAELIDLIEKVRARQDRNHLREKKKDKVANLKGHGMKARLRELGNEHGFSFAICQSARNVNLSLRVAGKKTGYHLSFPKGKFDEMIEHLPTLVTDLKNLANMGVTFRTNNKAWQYQMSEWILPESDDE